MAEIKVAAERKYRGDKAKWRKWKSKCCNSNIASSEEDMSEPSENPGNLGKMGVLNFRRPRRRYLYRNQNKMEIAGKLRRGRK